MDRIRAELRCYIETALWASIDCRNDECEPLDENFGTSDLTEECVKTMSDILHKFHELCEPIIEELGIDPDSLNDTQLAHDLWLTQNHHGAGFWEGDYDYIHCSLGERLTEVADSIGEFSLYVGDDDQIHICEG